jgi:hypothetical protein
MGTSSQPLLYSLPNELLLQAAGHLDSDVKHNLLNLSLVSKLLRPVAQEVLLRNPILDAKDERSNSWYNKKPERHRVLKFLGAMLVNPALALKVKKLSLEVIDKVVAYDYEEMEVFVKIQKKSLTRLDEMGYRKDPWYTMIEEWTESAFGGLLLTLLPNMVDLDIDVCERRWEIRHHDPLKALYGSVNTVASTLVMQKIQGLKFHITHLSMLSVDYPNLNTLKLTDLTYRQTAELVGEKDWSGAWRIKNLELDIPLRSSHIRYFDAFRISFNQIISNLKCTDLTHVCISLRKNIPEFSDHSGTFYEMQEMVEHMKGLPSNLEEIVLKVDEDQDYMDHKWILDRASEVETFTNFTALKCLVISQQFLTGENAFKNFTELLPPSIEELEIIGPRADILDRFRDFLDDRKHFARLKRIALHCPYDVNEPAEFFWEHEDPLWETLHAIGIEGRVHCQITGEWRLLNRRIKNTDAVGACLICNKRCGNVAYYINELDGAESDDDVFLDESDDLDWEESE